MESVSGVHPGNSGSVRRFVSAIEQGRSHKLHNSISNDTRPQAACRAKLRKGLAASKIH
jgi:hypothetical protein